MNEVSNEWSKARVQEAQVLSTNPRVTQAVSPSCVTLMCQAHVSRPFSRSCVTLMCHPHVSRSCVTPFLSRSCVRPFLSGPTSYRVSFRAYLSGRMC